MATQVATGKMLKQADNKACNGKLLQHEPLDQVYFRVDNQHP